MYIPYKDDVKQINMLFVFCLYGISQYNKETKCIDKIIYSSLSDLSQQIKTKFNISFSVSQLSKLLRETDKYNFYFSVNPEEKKIILNNNFRKKNKVRYVNLDNNILNTIIKENDSLLCKYCLYLYYYCGFSKDKKTDSTAEQILSKMGYSNSGNNKTKLSCFNSFLLDNKIIKINYIRDNNGHLRNVYSVG